MKDASVKKQPEKAVETPQLAAIRQLLAQAKIIRKNGSPDMADEALEWEKKLAAREQELQAVAA